MKGQNYLEELLNKGKKFLSYLIGNNNWYVEKYYKNKIEDEVNFFGVIMIFCLRIAIRILLLTSFLTAIFPNIFTFLLLIFGGLKSLEKIVEVKDLIPYYKLDKKYMKIKNSDERDKARFMLRIKSHEDEYQLRDKLQRFCHYILYGEPLYKNNNLDNDDYKNIEEHLDEHQKRKFERYKKLRKQERQQKHLLLAKKNSNKNKENIVCTENQDKENLELSQTKPKQITYKISDKEYTKKEIEATSPETKSTAAIIYKTKKLK